MTLAQRFVLKARALAPEQNDLHDLDPSIDDPGTIDEIMFRRGEFIGGMAAVIMAQLTIDKAADNTEINVTLFDKPSGNVRGMVGAFMPVKGKQRRIAHATLLVGEAPAVSIEVPGKVPLDEIEVVAASLKAFAAKVRELASDK